jgi:malonyl-CoA O-methyltransferase
MREPIPTRDAYRDWAAIYDSNENRTRDLDALVLRGAELPLDGAAVIEFGAGTGKNTAYLAERAASVLALDLSGEMLDKARARGLAAFVTFREHDVTTPWPAESASADIVIGNLVLEHIRDLAPVFAEIARVLKPGGTLFISELHPERQARGSQARFERDGEPAMVEAYVHTLSDYVTGAENAGLALTGINEAIEAGAQVSETTPPRILALTFSKPL